ncbi:MAG: hypothetical protein ACXWAT_05080 [Methylobacter sp.]
MLRILTDPDSKYCGCAEVHDYQLYSAINDIERNKKQSQRHNRQYRGNLLNL